MHDAGGAANDRRAIEAIGRRLQGRRGRVIAIITRFATRHAEFNFQARWRDDIDTGFALATY